MPRWTSENKTGYITSHGYKKISVNGKQVYEHRYIMENYIGRPLKKFEQIDHINGIKMDNRIENMQLVNIFTHLRLEHKRGTYKNNHAYIASALVNRIPKICLSCKKKYFKIKRWKTNKFCSAKCRNNWMKDELWKLSPQYIHSHTTSLIGYR